MHLATPSASRHVPLLAVAASALSLAVLVLRDAARSDVGLRAAIAAALVLALGSAFALWIGSMRGFTDASSDVEADVSRSLLTAIPDGLLLFDQDGVLSSNDGFCDLVGFRQEELVRASKPFPFWPPEVRHEIEAWHEELDARGRHDGELTFRHRDGRRLRVAVSGRSVAGDGGPRRHLLTVRDISAGYGRERRLLELATRDVETGLLNSGALEERLGGEVRRAIAAGANLTVVLAELEVAGRSGPVFRVPKALDAVERLRSVLRAGDDLGRVGDSEIALILPDTDAHGGVGAVARARAELAALDGITLTVGVCDLATAGDALALLAYADRALELARRQGAGGTVQYSAALVGGP